MRLISPSHQPRFGVTRSLFLTTCISKNWLYCSLTFHTTSSTLKAGMVFMHDSLWVIGRRKQREACVEQTQDGERRLTVHFFVDTAGYRPSVITMRRRREEHGGLIHTQVSVSLRALDHPGPHRTVRARRCWRESRAQFHVCRVPSHTTLRTHRSTTASAQYPGRYRGRGSAPGHGFRFLPAHRPLPRLFFPSYSPLSTRSIRTRSISSRKPRLRAPTRMQPSCSSPPGPSASWMPRWRYSS